MVEQVICLRTEGNRLSFSDLNMLHQRRIDVGEVRTTEAVTCTGSNRPRSRESEVRDIGCSIEEHRAIGSIVYATRVVVTRVVGIGKGITGAAYMGSRPL